jgi:Ca2+-dependent lipid-binding protein
MAQYSNSGTLTIHPVCARLIRDTELFGKMDPYCIVKLGGQAQKTAVMTNAGKYPCWTDKLVFRKTDQIEVLISVWDKDRTTKDDLVGEVKIPVENLIGVNLAFDGWIDLMYKNKLSGRIRLQTHFIPEGCKGKSFSNRRQQSNTDLGVCSKREQEPNKIPEIPQYKGEKSTNMRTYLSEKRENIQPFEHSIREPGKLDSTKRELTKLRKPKKILTTSSQPDDITLNPQESESFSIENSEVFPSLSTQKTLDLAISPTCSIPDAKVKSTDTSHSLTSIAKSEPDHASSSEGLFRFKNPHHVYNRNLEECFDTFRDESPRKVYFDAANIINSKYRYPYRYPDSDRDQSGR